MKHLSWFVHFVGFRLGAVLLTLGLVAGAWAQEASPEPSVLSSEVQPPAPVMGLSMASGAEISKKRRPISVYEPQHTYTLEMLGAGYPFYLRGVDGSDYAAFNVRADELVTDAQIDLIYSYSPALLADLSHINVLVNDVVAASLPVPREDAGKSLRRTIKLPPYLITEFNNLRLQLIGHYTLECEDPLHSSLWASVSNESRLTLDVQHISLPDDLSILPLPFFDRRDIRRLNLPMVFANGRSASALESAGMIASWFGSMAGYRGAQFPVHWEGDFPAEGNAIVFSEGGAAGAPAVLANVAGPTLAVTQNPHDARGKLLWVVGRNAQELKRAAQALVTGGAVLAGQVAVINELAQIKPRQPYDAPNWLRTDRPVKLGEIVPEEALQANGYRAGPVRIDLRMAPDLFGWREKPVPVDLRYRYTPQPGEANSTLLVNVEQQFLKSFPLLSVDQIKDESWRKMLSEGDMLPVKAKMAIPLERLVDRSALEFQFMYDYIKQGECRDTIVDSVRGRIDPDSSIDLSAYPHFMLMPNLAAFGDSGFPYTRMADLSETAVVFSKQPAVQDISTYLALMGRFGESTGYPATHVSVLFGDGALAAVDKDLIVIGSGDQSWLSGWAEYMPAVLAGQNKQFSTSDLVFKPESWLTPDPRESEKSVRTNLSYTSSGDSAVFIGFESPASKGRSVVLISSSEPHGQTLAVDALLDGPSFSGEGLQGSLSVVRDGAIHALVATYTYSIGQLGWWRSLEWHASQYWTSMPSSWLGWVVWILVVLLVLWIIKQLVFRRRKL